MQTITIVSSLVKPVLSLKLADRFEVLQSPIHGKGLFACGLPIAMGEIIMQISPEHFSNQKRHPWNRKYPDVAAHFINHSCQPNAMIVFSEASRAMSVVASRFIRPHEEITLDYHLLEVGGALIPCQCKSPNCKGTFPVNQNTL